MQRSYFPETLDLFEIGVRATGRARRALTRLRQASGKQTRTEQSARPAKKGRRPSKGKPRDRSRRRPRKRSRSARRKASKDS